MNKIDKLIALSLGLIGSVVYLLTLEPSVSFWDCGEFIATSYALQVGHPPGAPTYNLLAHCLMLLAGDNSSLLALFSNALSALAAGTTVGLLYSIILMLAQPQESKTQLTTRWAALVGSLCYLFCDTAWFSATESEVYSLATCFAAAMVWASLRWYRAPDSPRRHRWILLLALLAGLSVGVHQLALLALPSVALVFLFSFLREKKLGKLPTKRTLATLILLALLFFSLGLSTYAIVPIRAAAKPEICYGDPSTAEGFARYLQRDQYEKAPLWPRRWRHHANDAELYAQWSDKAGDLQLLTTYQFGYMYLRYLLWNFSGRFNDRQGFGGMQNGQFITGLPLVDDLIVGSSARPPSDAAGKSHNRYFALPLLLGILGAVHQCRRHRRAFFVTLTLFLMGGIVLGFYMNHPVYEPRERDYAYILSFLAFAIWIAFGALWILVKALKRADTQALKHSSIQASKHSSIQAIKHSTFLLLLAVPALMAFQNWDDHDRSHRHTAFDVASNMLNSCDQDAILITYGDNDTFPLWYAQQVEGIRPDITIANVNLKGGWYWLRQTLLDNGFRRPVFFSKYMHDYNGDGFNGHLQLTGLCYRLTDIPCDTLDTETFLHNAQHHIRWHNPSGVHLDHISRQFIETYWRSVAMVAERLSLEGDNKKAATLLTTTEAQLPLTCVADRYLLRDISHAYLVAGQSARHDAVIKLLKEKIADDTRYYLSVRPRLRQHVASLYTLPDDFWND